MKKYFLCLISNVTLGQWSTKGCELDAAKSSPTKTVCQCNHLTNFALLLQRNDVVSCYLSSLQTFRTYKYWRKQCEYSFFLPVFVLALQWSSYIFENNHDYWMYSFHLGVSSLLCHVSYTQVSFLSFFLFQINRTFLACARLYLVWPPTCDDFIKMYIFLTLYFKKSIYGFDT